MDILDRTVAVAIQPSSTLSGMLGFPYIIVKRFTVKELLDKHVIDENDIDEMKRGIEICKKIPIWRKE